MEFSEIRNIMYKSNEAAMIPIKLEESVPFKCEVNDVPLVAFFYWEHKKNIKVKYLFGVSVVDKSIVFLSESDITSAFNLDDLTFGCVKTNDFNQYYDDIDSYNEKFIELCSDPSIISSIGQDMYELLKRIVGEEIVEKLFLVVAEKYINALMNSQSETETVEESDNVADDINNQINDTDDQHEEMNDI